MIGRVTSQGRSFKGAAAYFLHDIGQAESAERVMFTHTVNMLTDDPEKAAKIMAWTAEHAAELKEIAGAKNTGRKAEKPVYNYVLAWAPDQIPDREHMTEFGLRSLEALGLTEHEALFIAHNDTDHMHLHVMVNRVHPVTGKMANMGNDRRKLSTLAQQYEMETGQIYCHERVRNNRLRDLGEFVPADKSERKADTQEYQERRQSRIDAQKKAATLHLEKIKAQDARDGARYQAQAAFDRATSKDDLQYRAREIDPKHDKQQAQTVWQDERKKQRTEADKAKKLAEWQQRQEQAKERRKENFENYAAGVWQKLADKQHARQDGLRDTQAIARQKFDARMERKYSLSEGVTQRRIDALKADLSRKGAKAVIERVTGERAQKQAQLVQLESGLRVVQMQKEREVAKFEARQVDAIGRQEKRQAAERERQAEKLEATRNRQEAAYKLKGEVREANRTDKATERAQSAQARAQEAQAKQATKSQAQQAEKARVSEAYSLAAREGIASTTAAREARAADIGQGVERSQQLGLGLGLGRGIG